MKAIDGEERRFHRELVTRKLGGIKKISTDCSSTEEKKKIYKYKFITLNFTNILNGIPRLYLRLHSFHGDNQYSWPGLLKLLQKWKINQIDVILLYRASVRIVPHLRKKRM